MATTYFETQGHILHLAVDDGIETLQYAHASKLTNISGTLEAASRIQSSGNASKSCQGEGRI
ncbi:hypothetical protein DC363_14440 [Thalassorhabdomicrobium marinisediminis]|uniref:Uncharacterized protein n=1 Tax=Thalassorhabdomicrobium marinisediminis TaxID=2170577 RepID=A0A2T7FU19_9RHOB|nr:hypothetical protein DC363_14440 [Thalassorhabdomicrobium marinisediminis]